MTRLASSLKDASLVIALTLSEGLGTRTLVWSMRQVCDGKRHLPALPPEKINTRTWHLRTMVAVNFQFTINVLSQSAWFWQVVRIYCHQGFFEVYVACNDPFPVKKPWLFRISLQICGFQTPLKCRIWLFDICMPHYWHVSQPRVTPIKEKWEKSGNHAISGSS